MRGSNLPAKSTTACLRADADRRAQVERCATIGAVGLHEIDAVRHGRDRGVESEAGRHFPRQEVRARGRRCRPPETPALEPRAEPAIAGARGIERHDERSGRVKAHDLAAVETAVEEETLATALRDLDDIERLARHHPLEQPAHAQAVLEPVATPPPAEPPEAG